MNYEYEVEYKQHVVEVVPSELVKSRVLEIMITRGVESVSHVTSLEDI